MESYGELLRKTREAKNGNLDVIAREISIEKRYLEGLENEDDSALPGGAYLKGFLRNYAIYLELDPEYILKIYHNKELQESAIPEGLYKPVKDKGGLFQIIAAIGLLVCIIVVIVVLLNLKLKKAPEGAVLVSNKGQNRTYLLSDKKFSQRVYKGDQFLIPTENNNQIVITVSNTFKNFGLAMPGGTFYVDLAEESELDIDGDGASDMIVYVADISSVDETRGSEVSILLRHGISASAETSDVYIDDIPFASEINAKRIQKVLIEDTRAYPFTINASFRDSCLFREQVDNSRAVETYFSKGEIFTSTPHNGIRMWISNSNTVKFSIVADAKSYDLDMGTAGQVLVEDIKWIKDTDGKYKLVVIELD